MWSVCACACVSLFLIVLFCCVKRLGVSVSVAALMWRMAHPPAAVHWTRRPRRAPAWFCTPTSRATTSGGSPSSTARTVTTTSRQSPCRETPPSPPSCECCVFIYTEEMNHVNSVCVCVLYWSFIEWHSHCSAVETSLLTINKWATCVMFYVVYFNRTFFFLWKSVCHISNPSSHHS